MKIPTPAQEAAIYDAMLALHAALHDYDENVSIVFCDDYELSSDKSAQSARYLIHELSSR